MNLILATSSARYDALMEPGSELDDLLTTGAEKARGRARVELTNVREAIGIQ